MPGGRLQPLARAMREYVHMDIEGRGVRTPSLDEAFDRIERGSISRRELLKIGGAVGAGLAFAACMPGKSDTAPGTGGAPIRSSSPTASDARVAIIGAGLAGTTAAYRLMQNGVHATCYEARDRIGGRCWTARGFAEHQTAEHGGEFIDTRHVHIRGLAKDLGLQLEDLWKGWVRGSVWPNWVDGDYLSRDVVKENMARITKAVTKQGHAIGVFDGPKGKATDDAISHGTATPGGKELDQQNMQEWLEQNVDGVNPKVVAYLNEVMASWYGLDMPGLSAANWVDFFLIPYPGGDERWHIEGGNDQVPISAAESLPDGTMQLESPLESLVKRPDGSYELRFGGGASSKPVVADFVIMTAPFTTLHDVDLEGAGFDGRRMDAIDTLGMGTDVKLLVQYNKRPHLFKVQGSPWSGGMEHTDPNYDMWDSTPVQSGKSAIITVYAGGTGSATFANPDYHNWAPEELTNTIVGQIDEVVPGTADHYSGKAWLDYWSGDPWTRGSYAAFVPGQMTKFWKYLGSPAGNVHFAGEHTSTYSQGFLNGGVESGQRTAIEVMEKLGVAVPKEIASLPYSETRE